MIYSDGTGSGDICMNDMQISPSRGISKRAEEGVQYTYGPQFKSGLLQEAAINYQSN
jgi:hypothetical protein